MPSTDPVAIRLDVRGNRLEIDWSDGHKSKYDGGYLRFLCPCAGCRGHGPGEVPEPGWAQCKDVRVTNVEAVGGYALRLTLSDGHATGIYSYDLLRAFCPSTRVGVDDLGRPR
jgi:DUF971 family protein